MKRKGDALMVKRCACIGNAQTLPALTEGTKGLSVIFRSTGPLSCKPEGLAQAPSLIALWQKASPLQLRA